MGIDKELHRTWKTFSEEEEGNFDYDQNRFPGGEKFKCKITFLFSEFEMIFIAYRHRTAMASMAQKKEFTKVFVPLDQSTKLQLDIVPESLKHRLLKKIGLQELEIGETEIDKKFLIQTNRENEVRDVLTASNVSNYLLALHPIRLKIKNGKRISEMELPRDKKFLYFETDELIKNEKTLKNLLNLFKKLAAELIKKNAIIG